MVSMWFVLYLETTPPQVSVTPVRIRKEHMTELKISANKYMADATVKVYDYSGHEYTIDFEKSNTCLKKWMSFDDFPVGGLELHITTVDDVGNEGTFIKRVWVDTDQIDLSY